MSETLGMLLLVVLAIFGLIALFLVVGVLFPRRVDLVFQAVDQMAGRALLLGLINTLFVAALFIGIAALAEATGLQLLFLLAILFLIIYVIGLVFGLTGMAQLVGGRLGPAWSPNRRHITGALALILGCLLPYVGWFGLFVYVSLLGVGGVILSFFRKNQLAAPETE